MKLKALMTLAACALTLSVVQAQELPRKVENVRLVDLNGKPFQKFAEQRDEWALNTCYMYPGPIQYFGPAEVCDQPSRTLYYEQGGK